MNESGGMEQKEQEAVNHSSAVVPEPSWGHSSQALLWLQAPKWLCLGGWGWGFPESPPHITGFAREPSRHSLYSRWNPLWVFGTENNPLLIFKEILWAVWRRVSFWMRKSIFKQIVLFSSCKSREISVSSSAEPKSAIVIEPSFKQARPAMVFMALHIFWLWRPCPP